MRDFPDAGVAVEDVAFSAALYDARSSRRGGCGAGGGRPPSGMWGRYAAPQAKGVCNPGRLQACEAVFCKAWTGFCRAQTVQTAVKRETGAPESGGPPNRKLLHIGSVPTCRSDSGADVQRGFDNHRTGAGRTIQVSPAHSTIAIPLSKIKAGTQRRA